METIIECPNCGRTIYFGTKPKECKIKNCCYEKLRTNVYDKEKQKIKTYTPITHREKKEHIMAFISNYRDYLVKSIYDKAKVKIGCYRTFNRLLKELIEDGKLKRMRYGFIRKVE